MTEATCNRAAIETLTHWSFDEANTGSIKRVFDFADFKTAWAFMTSCALKAEQMDHHPEWFNVYSRVEVLLTTHDAGGVTKLDLELASFMDALAHKFDSAFERG